jgi:GNAT superfamily N-acetyltransferase
LRLSKVSKGTRRLKFQKETVEAIRDEVQPLIEEHYQEISANLDIPLKPNWEKYIGLDHMGVLRIYTARNDAGELIGYGVYFVQKNLHYDDSLQAVQDILFIRKGFRGTGGRLIKWCDEQLKAEGVQVVYHHVKIMHDFGPLLERMGYKCIEKIYSRRLDKGGI